MTFPRITVDPAVCAGKPCIPYIEAEDIDEALRCAAFLADDETLELVR
jgi:uncharacterized protein (DUF433 family)